MSVSCPCVQGESLAPCSLTTGFPGEWRCRHSKSPKQEIDCIHDLIPLNLKRRLFLAKDAFRNSSDLFGDHDHLYTFSLKLRVEVPGGLTPFG